MIKSGGGFVTAMSPFLHENVAGKRIGWTGVDGEEGLEEALRSSPNGPFEAGTENLTAEEE